jgi:hypothetical protein
MQEHYAAVLADLRDRKNRLSAELAEVDAGISAIQRLAGELPQGERASWPAHPQQTGSGVASARFANISVRWGVLWQLAEFSQDFTKTGEIARALLAGGYQSAAERFPNLVSAVLSAMKAKGEVETNDDGGYRLTEKGRQTWALIRQGTKFRAATSTASEPSLLSVQ